MVSTFSIVCEQAFKECLELGVDRVLTSGGSATAANGSAVLKQMVELADGHAGSVVVLAGSDVSESNVAALVSDTGVTEV
jgi:copper homeostasis protein